MTQTINVLLLSLIVTLAACGENSKNQTMKTNTGINQSFKDSVDLPAVAGKDYKITHFRIKNGKALLNLIGSDISKNTSYFSSIDIKKRKLDFVIPDPSNDYVNSCFDVKGDTVVSLSGLHPDKVYFTNIHGGKSREADIRFDQECCISPNIIDVSNQQVFCTSDIYGFSVINIAKKEGSIFHEYLLGDYNSVIGHPVDTDINLLSGKRISSMEGAITLFAIDAKGNLKWSNNIDKKNSNDQNGTNPQLRIINNKAGFIVAYDSTIVCWDKLTGAEIWKQTFKTTIRNVLSVNNRLVVSGVKAADQQSVPATDSITETENIILIIETGSGKIILDKDYFSANGEQSFVVVGDQLILITGNELEIISITTGQVISKKKANTSGFFFKLLNDAGNGDIYLESKNTLYW